MKLTEFDAAIDAIVIDPRPRLKLIAANLVDSELGRQGLSSDQISRFAANALSELAASAKTSIERGDYTALDEHLTEFRMSLRRVMQVERERGELKPVTIASELERCRETLRHFLYFAPEVAALELKMTDGEKITAITWNAIETSKQVIRRAEMPAITRPSSFRDGPSWRSSFVSDAAIEQAQAEETRAQAPIMHQHGRPSRWIE